MIGLLDEKRIVLITRVIAKGCDFSVSTKYTCLKWLGEVASHWSVAPLYSRYSVQLGKMLNQDAVRGRSSAPYLRNSNIQWDHVVIDDLREMDFDPAERRKFALAPGDLLVCEGGDVGRTAMWRGELNECYFQKAVHRLRPMDRSKDVGRFLYYVLVAAAKSGVFTAEGDKSTIPHLTSEKLRRYRFPFPPYSEQRIIAESLDLETSKIDAMTAKLRKTIERLTERRAALISAAVTGQIDVRNIGHYGTGDLEITIEIDEDVKRAESILRQGYEAN